MPSPTLPDPTAEAASAQRTTKPRATPAQYRRRRIVAAVVAVLLLGSLVGGGGYAAAAASHALPLAATVVDAPAPAAVEAPVLAWPGYGAGAVGAVGVDGALDQGALARYGSEDALPIGSIAKVVTALLVLDAKPIPAGEDGPTITFGPDDVRYYNESVAENGSVASVSDGLELSEKQALTTMLVPSANNYATSLAVWAYGSMDAFSAAARTWLDARGLTRTSMADASGLSPDTVSTTTEMVALGELLVADPVLAEIVALKTVTIPGVGTLKNTNTLLGDQGIDGIKTGTTDEAGACLLFSLDVTVDGGPVTIVGAVVGAGTHPQLASDILALLPSVEAGFHTVSLTTAGTDYADFESVWGQPADAVSTEDASVSVWGAVSASTNVVLDPLSTVEDGEPVGTAIVTVNGVEHDVPLVAEGTIVDPGFGWRLTHPDELFAPAA